MLEGAIFTTIIIALIGIALLGGIGFGLYKFYLIKFRTKKAEPNQALLITGRSVFSKEELAERIKMVDDINAFEQQKVEKENELNKKKFDIEQDEVNRLLDEELAKKDGADNLLVEQLRLKQKKIFEPAIYAPLNPSNYTTAKIVRGGTIQLKFQQYATPINLNSFQLNVEAIDILVRGDDLIDARGVVQLSVGTTDIQLLRYAEQFLGKNPNDIQNEIREIISTHFRAILTTLTVEEINSNRESFNNRVKEIAQKDLDTLGFKLVNFGLIAVTDSKKSQDELGYLGNAEKIRKAIMNEKTAIVEAETKKNIEIETAKNENESLKQRNLLDIQNAGSRKDKEEELSRLTREIAETKAEAEKAEERQMLIQEQKIQEERNKVEQEKRQGQLQLALIQADEKKQVELRNLEIALEKEKREKERLEIQNAMELQKAQNSRKIEEEQIAVELAKKEAEITAKALEEEKIGKAKASAIIAEGQARAEVEEALAAVKLKTQDIYLKEKAIEIAPEIAKSIGIAMSGIDSVKLIGGGSQGDGIQQFTQGLSAHTAMTYDIMKELTGVDMKEIAYNKSLQHHVNVDVDNNLVDKNSLTPNTKQKTQAPRTRKVDNNTPNREIIEVKSDEKK